MSEFRIGYVSSIDYENGLCEVHYPDRDDTVTEKVPFISNREYRMPEVEDLVAVLHPGDSPEDAVVLGTIWNVKINRQRARRGSTARSIPTRTERRTESSMQTQRKLRLPSPVSPRISHRTSRFPMA